MFEIVNQSFEDFSSLSMMMADILIDNRRQVENRLDAVCGDKLKSVIENYGEIDEWWDSPFSFVLREELGLSVAIVASPKLITITVYKE